ncbi:ribokinase [Marinitenerispora sediminis]|uniref:Ribokinase n=1 Tax=Marinitenerispora sediminis TaxID=1931232 RepID=A0A368SZ72_9ACTN|nr:ribokinase [Marinitenerispora sediminis]RCV47994.1 ribokinase [Marinitenerispora sediminis]RCV49001.1 ribokinase [Marinitenerispora sediminis]RCV50588.1 ribokinase [Marinitenerispora sediminis]
MTPASAPRIAVFGSINMDLVAYVDAAPASGETVTGTEFRQIPGGKGANQALAAARAGGDVVFLGAVGDDAFGTQLRTTLVESGIEVSGLRLANGASGVAHIVVEGDGANSIIVIPGANGTVTGLEEDDVPLLEGSAALLLQLELPMKGVIAAARAGRAAGVPTVLTPAPAPQPLGPASAPPLPDELLGNIDLLVPNQHEAAALTGHRDPEEALAALLERVPEVLITLGEAGSLYGSRGSAPVRVPARQVAAVDTTAAGDTFCGAFVVARAEGRDPEQASRFAAAAASLAVQRHGASTSMPTRAEIDEVLAG